MDATIEHTLSKWPKFQVVTATKRRNMKYHLEPVIKQPMKKPIFICLTIVPISETKQPKNQPTNNSKILKKIPNIRLISLYIIQVSDLRNIKDK